MAQLKKSQIEDAKREALKALIKLSNPTTIPSGPGSKTVWSHVGEKAIAEKHWKALRSMDCVAVGGGQFQLI